MWAAQMCGQALKIQHRHACGEAQALYLSPLGFIFIGSGGGARVVDERGDLAASAEEAQAIVKMWGGAALLKSFARADGGDLWQR